MLIVHLGVDYSGLHRLKWINQSTRSVLGPGAEMMRVDAGFVNPWHDQ